MGAKRFKNYEDLRGANIGSSGITSGTAFVLRRMLAAKGLQTPKDYNLINVGPSAQSYLALTASRVDAALIAVPLSSDAAKIGYNIIGRASDDRPELSAHRDFDAALLGRETLRAMVCFMKAMARAMRRLYDNKEAAMSSSPKRCGSKPSTRAKAGSFTRSKKFGILAGRRTSKVCERDPDHGRTRPAESAAAEIGEYLDHSYEEEALKELGKR